jgi:phasin family protein
MRHVALQQRNRITVPHQVLPSRKPGDEHSKRLIEARKTENREDRAMTKSTARKSTEFVNPFEAFFQTGQDAQDTMQKFIDEGAARCQSAFASMPGQVAGFDGYLGDAAEANKANVEAVLAAGAVCGKGWSEINAEWMAFSSRMIEGTLASSKAAFGAKTLQEAIEMQSIQAKSDFEKVMAQNAKVGELATKVAQEAAAPISARVAATMETLNKTTA